MAETEYLWHYTTIEGLRGIIENHELWATDYRYLNDYSELITAKDLFIKHGANAIKKFLSLDKTINNGLAENSDESGNAYKNKVLDIVENTYETLNKLLTIYFTSFCIHPEDDDYTQKNGLLSQWRGYGRSGGYAIIFNKKKLIDLLKNQALNYDLVDSGGGECIYTNQTDISKKIEALINDAKWYFITQYINELIDANGPISNESVFALFQCMVFLKDGAFREENEFRLYALRPCTTSQEENTKELKKIYYREKSGMMFPYINILEKVPELPIEKIVIGPHQAQQLCEISLKSFLEEQGLSKIDVCCSDIPYKEY